MPSEVQIDPQTGERINASAAVQIEPSTGERIGSSASSPEPADLTKQNEIIDRMQPKKEGFLTSALEAAGETVYRPNIPLLGEVPVPSAVLRGLTFGIDPIQQAQQLRQIYQTYRGIPGEIKKGEEEIMKPGIMPKVRTAYRLAKALHPELASSESTYESAVKIGQQLGERNYRGAAGTLAGTVAPFAAPSVVEKMAGMKAPPTRAKHIEQAPEHLARGLGMISPDPQQTLDTYRQVLPHLADIDRAAPGGKAARSGETIAKAIQKKVESLGAPIRKAISENPDVPVGSDPAHDADIRSKVLSDIGELGPVVKSTRPDLVKLVEIGQGEGPLTLQEADTLRQYARMKASAYHNAEQRGANPAVLTKSMNDWQAAESYLKNVEYNKLRDLTGLDIERIQSDRSALLDTMKPAVRSWVRDLKASASNIAQSLGIPFGASRIINGAITMNPMEIVSGASEMGAFAGAKALRSQNAVIRKVMSELGRSDLKTPDYSLPRKPPPPPVQTAPPVKPTPPPPPRSRVGEINFNLPEKPSRGVHHLSELGDWRSTPPGSAKKVIPPVPKPRSGGGTPPESAPPVSAQPEPPPPTKGPAAATTGPIPEVGKATLHPKPTATTGTPEVPKVGAERSVRPTPQERDKVIVKSRSEKPLSRTGLTRSQTNYLADKLNNVTNLPEKSITDGTRVIVTELESGGKTWEATVRGEPYEKKGYKGTKMVRVVPVDKNNPRGVGPHEVYLSNVVVKEGVSITVPGDGTFKVPSLEAAHRLLKKIGAK